MNQQAPSSSSGNFSALGNYNEYPPLGSDPSNSVKIISEQLKALSERTSALESDKAQMTHQINYLTEQSSKDKTQLESYRLNLTKVWLRADNLQTQVTQMGKELSECKIQLQAKKDDNDNLSKQYMSVQKQVGMVTRQVDELKNQNVEGFNNCGQYQAQPQRQHDQRNNFFPNNTADMGQTNHGNQQWVNHQVSQPNAFNHQQRPSNQFAANDMQARQSNQAQFRRNQTPSHYQEPGHQNIIDDCNNQWGQCRNPAKVVKKVSDERKPMAGW